jgi:hypothetical protein
LLTTVTWTAYYATTADTFGTLASPTRTQIATGTFTVTSTVTNYTASISVPSAATTGIEIVLTVGAQTSGTWTIGAVQLEAGSSATPFERLPIGETLMLCQRYFYSATNGYGFGYGSPGSTRCGTILFPATMRATPTLAATGQSYSNSSALAFAGITAYGSGFFVTITVLGNLGVDFSYTSTAEL